MIRRPPELPPFPSPPFSRPGDLRRPPATAWRPRLSHTTLPAPAAPCVHVHLARYETATAVTTAVAVRDRKSTRLNSSHANISYAVFCLKKKKTNHPPPLLPT